jgi:predicted amidohydrolase YtcJ
MPGRPFILRAARVVADWRQPERGAEALAVLDGRVLAVGSLAEVWRTVGSDAPTRDLGDCLLAPAFHDAHLHLAKVALQRRILDIDPAWSLEELLTALRRAAAGSPSGWIVGRGWDHSSWGGWPDAELLDAAVPGRAVCLTRKDGHAVWLSSAALGLADITAEAGDPPGGEIGRRPDGSLSGILKETAIDLAYAALPQSGPETRRAALREIWPAFWSQGITAVTDMGFRGLDLWRDLGDLRSEGSLGLRVAVYVMEDGIDEALALGLPQLPPDPWLRAAGLKLFLDGTLGSRTAWLLDPYEGTASAYGLATMRPEDVMAAVGRAAEAGWPTAAHGIGDAAVRLALDAFAAHPVAPGGSPLRHRVEHVQLLHPADLPRFAAQGVWASLQPIHLAADWPVADAHWGAERCRRDAYPWRALLEAGASLALGSDAPIERQDVLPALRVAVTRRDLSDRPDGGWGRHQALPLAAALTGHTWGAAAACGWEGWLGSLSPGRAADLVALEGLPTAGTPEQLGEALRRARVRSTWLGGLPVWAVDDCEEASAVRPPLKLDLGHV